MRHMCVRWPSESNLVISFCQLNNHLETIRIAVFAMPAKAVEQRYNAWPYPLKMMRKNEIRLASWPLKRM